MKQQSASHVLIYFSHVFLSLNSNPFIVILFIFALSHEDFESNLYIYQKILTKPDLLFQNPDEIELK